MYPVSISNLIYSSFISRDINHHGYVWPSKPPDFDQKQPSTLRAENGEVKYKHAFKQCRDHETMLFASGFIHYKLSLTIWNQVLFSVYNFYTFLIIFFVQPKLTRHGNAVNMTLVPTAKTLPLAIHRLCLNWRTCWKKKRRSTQRIILQQRAAGIWNFGWHVETYY